MHAYSLPWPLNSESLNRGEQGRELSNHPSWCLREVLWVHTCFRIVWLQRLSSLSILSAVYLRHWQLLSSWSLVNNTATSILPRGEHHSAGSRASSKIFPLSLSPSLWRPLIHFFCRQNPSPFGTCLTEGKNGDEIAGSGSIPLIPLSISAAIHQPVVVVVDDVGVVWRDAAPVPYIFTGNGTAELWLSTETRDEIILGMFGIG